ncbi:hypothetical protein F66182_9218 [Fusarium sp. NRRL 66182]|nr:hypothetical protein F66182_9218 [Fusarium sp. NRRL 66182]
MIEKGSDGDISIRHACHGYSYGPSSHEHEHEHKPTKPGQAMPCQQGSPQFRVPASEQPSPAQPSPANPNASLSRLTSDPSAGLSALMSGVSPSPTSKGVQSQKQTLISRRSPWSSSSLPMTPPPGAQQAHAPSPVYSEAPTGTAPPTPRLPAVILCILHLAPPLVPNRPPLAFPEPRADA